jgi:hypothetical protein
MRGHQSLSVYCTGLDRLCTMHSVYLAFRGRKVGEGWTLGIGEADYPRTGRQLEVSAVGRKELG